MRLASLLVGLLVLPAASAPRLEEAVAGTWKLNVGKSTLTGTRDAIESAGPDGWTFHYGAFTWTVKPGGKEVETPFGNTVALEVRSANVWRLVDKINDRIVATETWTLSADGKSMTRIATGTKADGRKFSDTTRVRRVDGKSGFAGTWETQAVKISVPSRLAVKALSTGIELADASEGFSLKCSYDGKAYAVSGPTAPANAKVTCARHSGRSITFTSKLGDVVLRTIDWLVSSDGTTLTSTQRDAGAAVPIIAVYDRQ